MRRHWALLGMAAALGCTAEIAVPDGARIACAPGLPCPAGWRCSPIFNKCIPASTGDETPPELLASPAVEPAEGRDGTTFSVSFSVNEELGLDPIVRFIDGRRFELSELLSDRAERRYAFRYTASSANDRGLPTDIVLELVDRSENAIEIPVGAITLDFDGPVVVGDWADDPYPTVAGPSTSVRFAATTEADASVTTATLIAASGPEVESLPFTARVAAASLIIEGEVDFSVIAIPAGETSVTVRFVAFDRFGNATDPMLTDIPALDYDDIPPETTLDLSGGPGAVENDRRVTLVFGSNDAQATFECALEPDGVQPVFRACASPFTALLPQPGRYVFEVRAIDAAGNVDPTPAAHAWTVALAWQTLGAGSHFACAIATDSSLWCWGWGTTPIQYEGVGARSPNQIGEQLDWVDVSVGSEISAPGYPPLTTACAIRSAGTARELWCWGQGPIGIGDSGSNYGSPVQLAGQNWQSVAVAVGHRCAIDTTGALWCWGFNSWHGVGTGVPISYPEPIQIGNDTDWLTVDVESFLGPAQTCGIRDEPIGRSLWCWGSNGAGQLGTGDQNERTVPTRIGSEVDWTAVSVGQSHSCGLRGTGELWCWGDNSAGQVGLDPAMSPVLTPQRIGSDTWTAVRAGFQETCGTLANGEARCWGSDVVGQRHRTLGPQLAPIPFAVGPQPVDNSLDWRDVFAGSGMTCGIRNDSSISCWGDNSLGHLGDGYCPTCDGALAPVAGTGTWSSLGLGSSFTCARQAAPSTGSLWCWGTSAVGAQGYAGGGLPVPSQVGSVTDWALVTAGAAHACGVQDVAGARVARCWGSDARGTLGDGPIGHPGGTSTPVDVGLTGSVPDDWDFITAGSDTTLGIRDDGAGSRTLWLWGVLVGQGASNYVEDPVQVGSEVDWLEVDGASAHACAIRDDGASDTLWCWGANSNGQLGLNTTNTELAPVRLDPPYQDRWLSVATGVNHTCGIRDSSGDRLLYCWGESRNGRLGVPGLSGSVMVPAQLIDDDWLQVSAGLDWTCALKLDGSLWCWGAVPGAAGPQPAPTRIGNANDWAQVLVRGRACATKTNGTSWCWGDETNRGQYGEGAAWGPVEVPPP